MHTHTHTHTNKQTGSKICVCFIITNTRKYIYIYLERLFNLILENKYTCTQNNIVKTVWIINLWYFRPPLRALAYPTKPQPTPYHPQPLQPPQCCPTPPPPCLPPTQAHLPPPLCTRWANLCRWCRNSFRPPRSYSLPPLSSAPWIRPPVRLSDTRRCPSRRPQCFRIWRRAAEIHTNSHRRCTATRRQLRWVFKISYFP